MIRVLEAQVANKIAAGEVIERPASLAKELVENSLDAGARRVLVEVEEGGKKLVRVTDDGEGIGPDDLARAFLPHATSKIRDADDLFEILSFGFRGEALASIGSVARCRIISRQADDAIGHRVDCERSVISEVIEAGGPKGTIVEVRDLFFETPARRKFLKSDAAEIARISETLTRLSLPLHDLEIELRHNGRLVFRIDRAEDNQERLHRFFGREVEGKLLPIHGERDGISLQGFIGTPDVARGTSTRQYLYVNDRFVRDKSLAHAVQRAYEGFLMPKRYPFWFLDLSLDPSLVDVNVHPAKAEVRFRHRDQLFSLIQRTVQSALESARPMAEFPLAAPQRTAHVQGVSEAFVPLNTPLRSKDSPSASIPSPLPAPAMLFPEPAPNAGASPIEPRAETEHARSTGRFMQIHDSYLLVEDDDGFYIVDQHALHERKLFEEMLAARGEEGGSQRLLVPEIVDLPPGEFARIDAMREELAQLGFEVRPFGGTSIAVEALPASLHRIGPRRLVEAVLKGEGDDGLREIAHLNEDRLAHRACRAAVKFRDRLSDEEIRDLITWERSSAQSAACPHGRPTRIRISLSELERRFMRKE